MSHLVIAQIMSQLNEVFVEMDAKVLEASKKWAFERSAAVSAFYASDEYKTMPRGEGRILKAMAIAGGKTWYNIIYGTGDEYILNFVEKNCKAIATKRNASIAKKLEKAGVTEVTSQEFTHTNDGFNGMFMVNTDKGAKRVIIESIYAGGYNVQCLHLRVLVKIK